ncbi:MAG: ABC transporter ATP-binding protein [Lautropia sp.]
MNPPVLETRTLSRRFGGIVATDSVSIAIPRGARHALIGPNGAGKTTLINLLTGVLAPSSGTILLDGDDVTRLAPHRRVARGLVRTFQINQLFAELTPLASLALAVSQSTGNGGRWWRPLGALAGGGSGERGGDDGSDGNDGIAARCDALLRQFQLTDVMDRRVPELAYGQRRLLEIALALAGRPRVLLLDEPAAGVPAGERRQISDVIRALPDDVTVVLIEHDMDLVFNFARSVSVLVNGAVLVDGDVAAVAADPRVREVYLGESVAAHHA